MLSKYLLTVAIPVFNERTTLEQIVERVLKVDLNKEVIIVDDGSIDGTTSLVQRLASNSSIQVFFHRTNLGKGAAVRTALKHAKGDFFIVQDGDLEYDPMHFARLLSPIVSNSADVVLGSRRMQSLPFKRRLFSPHHHGVTLLNFLVWLLYGHPVSDEATCYKVFRTKDLRRMELVCMRFEFCPEVIAKSCRLGLRIEEIAINYSPRGKRDGKKIRFIDAIEAVTTLWRFRKWFPQATNLESTQSRHYR